MRARAWRQSKPAGRENSQNVPVSEQRRISPCCAYPCNHTIDANADLLRSFSAGGSHR